MGCCTSSAAASSNTAASGNAATTTSATKNVAGKEDKIELAFKAKRANVFAEGMDDDLRRTYMPKKIAKNQKQAQTIRKISKFVLFRFFYLLRAFCRLGVGTKLYFCFFK